jgi:hypothetical protein
MPNLIPGYSDVSTWVNQPNLTHIWDKLSWNELAKNLPESVKGDLLGGTSLAAQLEAEQVAAQGGPLSDAQKQSIATQMSKQNVAAGQDVMSGLGWLREAMNIARGGVKGKSTRAQQKLAGEHLATLFREAEKEPGRAGRYTTMFENLVNPVLARAPQSGIFGFSRALSQPAGEFRRKNIAFRNPTFT